MRTNEQLGLEMRYQGYTRWRNESEHSPEPAENKNKVHHQFLMVIRKPKKVQMEASDGSHIALVALFSSFSI